MSNLELRSSSSSLSPPREVWVTLSHDQEQAGRVEVDGKHLDIEHLRKAVKIQFELDVPHQKISIFVPDLSKGVNGQGRHLHASEKPLLPNERIEAFCVPFERAEYDVDQENQEKNLPGHTFESALLVSFMKSDHHPENDVEGEEVKANAGHHPMSKQPSTARCENSKFSLFFSLFPVFFFQVSFSFFFFSSSSLFSLSSSPF
jgi:hypothetical protein